MTVGILRLAVDDYKGLLDAKAKPLDRREGRRELKAFTLRTVPENAQWVDDHEHSAAAGENVSFLIDNFGDPRQTPATFADLPRFHAQPTM
jgi:hypothetical protein